MSTNFDEIKATITVDQMARLLYDLGDCEYCPVMKKCTCVEPESCPFWERKTAEAWLREEV